MTNEDIKRFHGACRAVVAKCPDPYAKSYADAGLGLRDDDYVQTQCLYILNNMGRWRGEHAAGPRTVFKELSKRKPVKS